MLVGRYDIGVVGVRGHWSNVNFFECGRDSGPRPTAHMQGSSVDVNDPLEERDHTAIKTIAMRDLLSDDQLAPPQVIVEQTTNRLYLLTI